MKINGKKILLFFITLGLSLGLVTFVRAQTCSSESECNDLINQYQGQITKLQGQANTLSNQIAQFDAQIKLTTLKISQTEEKIKMLGGRIDQLEDSITSLEAAFSSRAVETYKLSRFEGNFVYVLTAPDIENTVARFHYLQKIQEADRNLFERLQTAQTNYKVEKVDQEDLQKELNKQKANLSSQKAAKANLLAATKNDEKKYQQLLAQAQAQLNAFKSFVSSKGGASILSNQTKCDSWGCYYNQRDSQWGNMGIGSSGVSMADAGCLVTSVAMIAKHYGKNINPLNIALSSAAFFANTAYMNTSWSDAGLGISVSRSQNSVSTGLIDSEINAGRPVIAGVYGSYSYPQHFIVIKGKDDTGYIMYDPFLKDGGEGVKHLSDGGYSLSNLVRIDKVTIN